MSNIKTLIQPSIAVLCQFRGYALKFGEQIETACDIMGLKSDDIKEVLPCHSGGGFIHVFMQLKSGQIIGFNYVTDGIILTHEMHELDDDFFDDVYFVEDFSGFEETELNDPNPDFITSNLLK